MCYARHPMQHFRFPLFECWKVSWLIYNLDRMNTIMLIQICVRNINLRSGSCKQIKKYCSNNAMHLLQRETDEAHLEIALN